jgi:hypothetical protein
MGSLKVFYDCSANSSQLLGSEEQYKLRESRARDRKLKAMDTVTLRAHFDGQKICLDEPFDMEPNTELIVTVLPKRAPDEERADWAGLSQQSLADAYGEDEMEYSLDRIKEPNLEYEGG